MNPYNNSTNGFDRAQRAYDNMLPPEPEDIEENEEDEEQSRLEAHEAWLDKQAEKSREEESLEMPKSYHLNPQHDKYSGLGECKENE